jgi:hypoxia up-regulated 1
LSRHPVNRLSESNRSTLAFEHGDGIFTIEELIAMQFANVKVQAEEMANEQIRDLVLTVPAFWSEQERKAIINAAELAGMQVSSLIQDGLAGRTLTCFVKSSRY